MAISNRRNNQTNFDKVDLDKKMGQFLDVGRQFVDGVSGARPGQRRPTNIREFSIRNANNVRKWVNNRVDSFFEDEYEEDWEYEDNTQDIKSFSRQNQLHQSTNQFIKRPLEALSRRELENSHIVERKQLPYSQEIEEEWPDDSDFQISRWKRSQLENESSKVNIQDQKGNLQTRNLPKSRRRRT